jgi:cystathionine beta-lyase
MLRFFFSSQITIDYNNPIQGAWQYRKRRNGGICMVTDFNQIIDRKQSDSLKWNCNKGDVIPLWVADTDFLCPQPVINALQSRVEHGIFGYFNAFDGLTDAILQHLLQNLNWRVQPQDILLLPGVVTTLNLACQTVANPGEGLITNPPIYGPFLQLAANGGFESQLVALQQNLDGTYYLDLDDLKSAVKPNSRVIALCNPHNPVGRVYTREELEAIAKLCIENDLYVCSDDMHSDLIFSGHHHTPIASLHPEIAKRSITIMAPGKTFNIAGLDCAFAVITDEGMRKRFIKAQKGLFGHVNLLGQVAAEAAYTYGQIWLKEMMTYLEGNRDFMVSFVNQELNGIQMTSPEGTFLAWLDCRQTPFAKNPAAYMLENAKVLVNDGSFFGEAGKGFIRINFGCPRSTLQEGLFRIQRSI